MTDSLVQFNPSTNKVTVDTRASCFYADFAGLHECICCGKYGDLAPKGAEGIDRCGFIDIMLLDYMSDGFASVYREKRIEMYKTLIERNLNPKLNDRFERAIAILEKK